MKKLFTDHVSVWMLLLLAIAIIALVLSIVNTKRIKAMPRCLCSPKAENQETSSASVEPSENEE